MSARDPEEAVAIDAPTPQAVGNDLLERLAWLDLSDTQCRFARDADADAPYHFTYVSLEYRRFLLLRLTYPQLSIPAPPLIDRYWRLHAAEQSKFAADCTSLVAGTDISPETLAPPPQPCAHPPGQQIRDLYQSTFPCGDADLWGWPKREHGPRTSAPSPCCTTCTGTGPSRG